MFYKVKNSQSIAWSAIARGFQKILDNKVVEKESASRLTGMENFNYFLLPQRATASVTRFYNICYGYWDGHLRLLTSF